MIGSCCSQLCNPNVDHMQKDCLDDRQSSAHAGSVANSDQGAVLSLAQYETAPVAAIHASLLHNIKELHNGSTMI